MSNTLILVYVDDMLIVENSTIHINQLKNMLSSSFHMKDLVNVSYFIGLEVHRSIKGFFIYQKKYILDLLKEYHIEGIKSSKLLYQLR